MLLAFYKKVRVQATVLLCCCSRFLEQGLEPYLLQGHVSCSEAYLFISQPGQLQLCGYWWCHGWQDECWMFCSDQVSQISWTQVSCSSLTEWGFSDYQEWSVLYKWIISCVLAPPAGQIANIATYTQQIFKYWCNINFFINIYTYLIINGVHIELKTTINCIK